jgi:hypothetical protein
VPDIAADYGKLLMAQLNAIGAGYPDAQKLALMRQVAGSHALTAEQTEVCWSLLGDYANMSTLPVEGAALVFPRDHALHPDYSIEWYYFALSLPLPDGRLVSVVCSFFTKTITSAALAPSTTAFLGHSVCSTSIGVTIETPGQPGQHYAWPVQSFFGADADNVAYSSSPAFSWRLGKQSISGTGDVFPVHIHLEDAGDASFGRPPIVIDVDCAATNPLFLQGVNGYYGQPGQAEYYYYSWPQQRATGTNNNAIGQLGAHAVAVLTALAAVTVALFGIRRWRHGRRVNAEYAAALALIRAPYTLREALSDCRSHIV